MLVKRESFYRCTLSSPGSSLVAHVRAWDREEALQLFRGELDADGVSTTGTVEVVRLGEPEKATPVARYAGS